MTDRLLEVLAEARPPIDAALLVADETVAEGAMRGRPRRIRSFQRTVLAGAAAVVVAALAITSIVVRSPADLDISLVASTSKDALSGTGRAVVDFVIDQGTRVREPGPNAHHVRRPGHGDDHRLRR